MRGGGEVSGGGEKHQTSGGVSFGVGETKEVKWPGQGMWLLDLGTGNTMLWTSTWHQLYMIIVVQEKCGLRAKFIVL